MARRLKECDLSSAAARRATCTGKRDVHWHEIYPQTLAVGWRRDGRWMVRRYDPDTGAYSQMTIKGHIADDHEKADGVHVLNYKQAVDAAKAADAAKLAKAKTLPKPALTVRQACEDYVNNHLARRRKRSREILLTFELQVFPVLGDKAVRDLTTKALEDWFDAQRNRLKSTGERRSAGDCNRTLAYLRAALNRAYRDESHNIPSDKAWRAVKPLSNAGKSRCSHYLDPGQVKQLLDATDSAALRNLITGAFLSGCRPPSELAFIKAKHFNLETGKLEIARSKTGSRIITLSNEAKAFFAELCQGKTPDALLFTRDNGRPWIDGDAHQNRLNSYHVIPFRQAVAAAGLPPKTTLYALRHSFISLAIASPGCNLLQLARHCGTSVQMIESFYGHFRDADEQRMVEAMSPKLGLRVVA
jgi:integrase